MPVIHVLDVPASAQEIKRDGPQIIGHLGLSGVPVAAGKYFTRSSYSDMTYGSMASIYGDYYGAISTAGTLIAGVDFKLNRVVAVTVDLGVNVMWRSSFSGVSQQKTGTDTGVAVYLLPMAKLYYIDRNFFRMYGTAGLGVGIYFGYPTNSYDTFRDRMKCEVQFVPIGIEFGRKFFGFAELGAGTIFVGAHAGIGYKF